MDATQRRFAAAFSREVAGAAPSLHWQLPDLWRLRDRRLRRLLRAAKASSPWHAERLAGVDVDAVDGESIAELPSMTRADLDANWDDIVTDRRLSRRRVVEHLERVAAEGPALLDGMYVAMYSGGSIGAPTPLVWRLEDLVATSVSGWRQYAREPQRPSGRTMTARIHAGSPVHATSVSSWLTTGLKPSAVIASTLRLAAIVERLNELQPTELFAYASLLPLLAREHAEGRLTATPEKITSAGEALDDAARSSIEDLWCPYVVDLYSSSESLVAQQRRGERGLHLVEDVAVFEPVDERGRAPRAGERASALLVTNVLNSALPLIRYALADDVQLLGVDDTSPWPERVVLPPTGRKYPWFSYASGVGVHSFGFEDAMAPVPGVADFQIARTERGVRITVVPSEGFDGGLAVGRVHRMLVERGLVAPAVELHVASELSRTPIGGKLVRYVA